MLQPKSHAAQLSVLNFIQPMYAPCQNLVREMEPKKKRKKILTAPPVRKKLAEEEANKVNDKAKKLFDRKKDNSEQDAKLRKKPERNVHR